MTAVSDAGLPPPGEWFGLDALRRWPLGAGYAELVRGRAVWAGPWDERDVATAQICFPGRKVYLTRGDRALVVTRADDEDLGSEPSGSDLTAEEVGAAIER